MPTSQLLDPLSIAGVFIAFALVTMACYEGGFRVGRWWQEREPGEQEGPTGMLVGSILALQAFLLAVTIGMASDRFDARRAVVLQEANAIGTTYLRAGYLPEPASSEIRELLREYVPLRIVVTESADIQTAIAKSVAIHQALWAIAEDTARTTERGDLVALFIESLNETIDLHETRVTAGSARVPQTVLLLLVGGSALGLGDGRLQRGTNATAQPVECGRARSRAGCGDHDRGRPGSPAGRLHPGEPTAAHRPPATDRTAVTIGGLVRLPPRAISAIRPRRSPRSRP